MAILERLAEMEPQSANDLAMLLVVWWGVYPDGLDDDMGLASAMNEPMRRRVLSLAGMMHSPNVEPAYFA